MTSEGNQEAASRWTSWVEKFEMIVVSTLTVLLVVIVTAILITVAYLFARKIGTFIVNAENITEIQQVALNAFSGILLVLLGLELLDTIKVYFKKRSVRVEVILMVGLIAMGRHVLQIDLHHIEPMILFGFSSLILALALGYFLVKRAPVPAIGHKYHTPKENSGSRKET